MCEHVLPSDMGYVYGPSGNQREKEYDAGYADGRFDAQEGEYSRNSITVANEDYARGYQDGWEGLHG